MTDTKWFTDYQEWVRYVNRYMMNAERQDGVYSIIIKNGNEQTIAAWQKPTNGIVYENRSPERLEKDIQKLK